MLNVIKMDLYRMLRSKSTWMILLIVGMIAAASMYTMHREHLYYVENPEVLTAYDQKIEGVSAEEAENMKKEYAENPKYSADGVFDGYYFYSNLMQGVQGYVIAFCIALFAVIFAGSENSTGFIKNIAGQPSIRYRTILSKCVSILFFSTMVLFITFVVALIGSQLLYGYVLFGLYSISDMFVYAFTQLLLNAALGIVIMCFSELIENQVISMAIGAMLSIGVARLITENLDDFFAIDHFSFSYLLITLNKSTLPLPFNTEAYQLSWAVGIAFIILATGISILTMKKKDIR